MKLIQFKSIFESLKRSLKLDRKEEMKKIVIL